MYGVIEIVCLRHTGRSRHLGAIVASPRDEKTEHRWCSVDSVAVKALLANVWLIRAIPESPSLSGCERHGQLPVLGRHCGISSRC